VCVCVWMHENRKTRFFVCFLSFFIHFLTTMEISRNHRKIPSHHRMYSPASSRHVCTSFADQSKCIRNLFVFPQQTNKQSLPVPIPCSSGLLFDF
jgi:hypothetical protein